MHSLELRDIEPTLTQEEIQIIFEAKMEDLGLDLKLHLDQFKTFKRLLDKTCANRKVNLHDVRSSSPQLIARTGHQLCAKVCRYS